MEANIEEFLNWVPQADRATAAAYLKAKNNDIQSAVSAFYDGEKLPRYEEQDKYDESAFAAGRDGGDVQMGESRAFEMDAPDNINPRLLSAPTPSRSNSRNSNRGAGGDLTAEYNGGILISNDPLTTLTLGLLASDTSGEDPIEVAMRQSRQETGITTASDPVYGPAVWIRKEDVVPDLAEAKDRKRDPGHPVFLKPLPGGFAHDHLPGIVTILSTIPLAREALMCRNVLLPDYGKPDGWWSGTAIPLPRTIVLRDSAPRDEGIDVIHEAQRLMAFLQRSSRSYGSVQPLSDLPALWDVGIGDNGCDNRTLRFLRAWKKAVENLSFQDNMSNIFASTFISTTGGENRAEAERCWLELSMINGLWGSMSSLYDAIDASLWRNDRGGDSASYDSIDRAGEIMIIHLPPKYSNANLSIPADLYLDRYLRDNADLMRLMRCELAQSCSTIEKFEERQAKLKLISPSKNKTYQSTDVIRTVATHFEDAARAQEDENNFASESPPRSSPSAAMPDRLYIAQHLKTIADTVQRKLQSLEEEKERIIAQMRETASILTKPATSANQPSPRHRQFLCGVITKPNITYVLYPGPAKDSDMIDDVDDQGPRWWRLEYPLVENGLIVKTVVDETDVLTAATREGPSVTLVYASEEAVRSRPLDLPVPIERFVTSDNIAFAEELGGYSTAHGTAVLAAEPTAVESRLDDDMLPDYDQSQRSSGKVRWDEMVPISLRDDADDAPMLVDPTQTGMMEDMEEDEKPQEMQEKGMGGFLGSAGRGLRDDGEREVGGGPGDGKGRARAGHVEYAADDGV